MKKKERVEQVTHALLGFRPGQRIRVVHAARSHLPQHVEGAIVTLDYLLAHDVDVETPKNRWRLREHSWWLAESSMEEL